MRIPRKRKKAIKKKWFKRDGVKLYIVKSSIGLIGKGCWVRLK